VTPARVEDVAADVAEARRIAAQAGAHLESAGLAGVDSESAYGLCYQAVLKAFIAVLLADGRRVTGGTGGHVLVLREAGTRLELPDELIDRLDALRRARHRVFYDAAEVSRLELEGARRDARAAVEAARRWLAAR
jgi:HEPN domain-containing protein